MEPLPARHGSRILIKALLGTSALGAASVASLSALFLLRDRAAFQRQFELRAEALAGSLAGQSQFALPLAHRTELEHMARVALDGELRVAFLILGEGGGG